MYGQWLRVSSAELEHAKADLDWAEDFAESVAEAEYQYEDNRDLPDRRSYGTDKAWHALDYLLQRKGFPVAIIFGEERFTDDDVDDTEADWGYGAPGYLTPVQVRQAAAALAELTREALLEGVDPAELQREEIYPAVWDRPGELEWPVGFLPDIKTYFNAAAAKDEAIICWIS
ncbi:MAG TPA: DUF1877 domain-containing protein [Micromonosporaceae bacterium]|nr:DUF1877 domain-containing protein [Micromonosporaceae bacterium]